MAAPSGRSYKHLAGVDATIDISLLEYGMVWFDDPDKDEIEFFYGIKHDDNDDYCQFDNGWFKRDLDPKQEWNWIEDWNDVASSLGMAAEEFLKLPLTQMVFDLVNYYGYQNIFGETHWGAWYWNKNLQRFQTEDPVEAVRFSHMKRGHFVKENT